MFSKLSLLTAASLALSVLAGGEPTCNTGPIQCCQELHNSHSAAASAIFALVGASAQDFTGQVGLNCSPVTAIGVGNGASCSSKPVCCKENNFHGHAVSLGCSPINAGF